MRKGWFAWWPHFTQGETTALEGHVAGTTSLSDLGLELGSAPRPLAPASGLLTTSLH